MRTRRWRRNLWCGLVLLCAGCNLLEDEFGWMDRRAPASSIASDAPAGTDGRP